jgi:hypothetical protein
MNNKIKRFIDNSSKKYIVKKKYLSSFVKKTEEIIKSEFVSEIFLKKREKVKKINDDKKEPLLFRIFKEINYPNNRVHDYEYFLSWYRKNSTEINLQQIISSSKKYYEKIYNPIKSRYMLHKLFYENSFVFLDVIHCGEIFNLTYDEYSSKDNNTNIYLYYIDGEKEPDIQMIMRIITLFRKISKKEMKLDLTIFYCNQKRYFPLKEKLLTPENINAGCTVFGRYVYVWRKEEFYKVLIHELVHYFSLDFHDIEDSDNEHLEKMRDSVINIKGHDVVNETYTEILAITLNSIMCSVINNIDFSDIINYEIVFTHFQIAKIINFFGGNTYDDLFKIIINQKTSVASYVIIKGMFLNNYEKILKHFDNLNFGNSDKKRIFNNYKKLYGEIVNRESLNKELINHFLNIIKDKNNVNNEKFIMKTLRMTMCEIL